MRFFLHYIIYSIYLKNAERAKPHYKQKEHHESIKLMCILFFLFVMLLLTQK